MVVDEIGDELGLDASSKTELEQFASGPVVLVNCSVGFLHVDRSVAITLHGLSNVIDESTSASGRGLHIIEQLASRRGVQPLTTGTGKLMWASVATQ